MKFWSTLSFIALVAVFTVPEASAAYCPTSVSKATANSKCRCRRGVRKSTLTFKYKRKRSLSSSKAKRWARSRAISSAKARCRKLGSRVGNFKYRVTRWRNKNTLGFNTGYVVLSYSCSWAQRKHSIIKKSRPYLGRRTYSASGKSTYKKKGIRLSRVNACRRADSAAKRYIAKKYNARVTWYKRRGHSWKKTPFYLRCTVKWNAKYRRWFKNSRRYYFCR